MQIIQLYYSIAENFSASEASVLSCPLKSCLKSLNFFIDTHRRCLLSLIKHRTCSLECPTCWVGADASSRHLKAKNELAGLTQRATKVEDRGFMPWTLISLEHHSKAQSGIVVLEQRNLCRELFRFYLSGNPLKRAELVPHQFICRLIWVLHVGAVWVSAFERFSVLPNNHRSPSGHYDHRFLRRETVTKLRHLT